MGLKLRSAGEFGHEGIFGLTFLLFPLFGFAGELSGFHVVSRFCFLRFGFAGSDAACASVGDRFRAGHESELQATLLAVDAVEEDVDFLAEGEDMACARADDGAVGVAEAVEVAD